MTDTCKVHFLLIDGTQQSVEVAANTKVLAAANRQKIPLRFGCASCRCGTCAVAVTLNGEVKPMQADERALLTRMNLPTDATVRLACQTRILAGEMTVDLAFQNTYSPDQGDDLD